MAFNASPESIIEQNVNGLLGTHESWSRTPLSSIAKVTNGFAFKSSFFNGEGKGERVIRIRDVLPGDTQTYYSGPVPEGYWVEREDMIVGMDGDFNLAWWPSSSALLNQRVCRIDVFSKSYDKRFIFRLLPGYLEAINVKTSSTTVKHLSSKTLNDLLVPLPPIAEQKVIADKLDTLLAQVETTKARLERIPNILKRFRQSVFIAAVSGKLETKWRAQELSLSDVASFQNGFAFKSGWFETSGEYQVIKLANIRDGCLTIENSPAFVRSEIARDFLKYSPKNGDTLLSMTGTRFKRDYGYGCMIEKEENFLVNQRVGRLIPKKAKIIPEYLNIFVRSDKFRDQFFEGETGGVNQGNVGSKHVMTIRIQIPSIEMQNRIVRRVNKLVGHADRIENQVSNALRRINNITRSILAKAFRGELTEQWRKDNPDLISGENSAEALLERIKAEREQLSAQKPKHQKKYK